MDNNINMRLEKISDNLINLIQITAKQEENLKEHMRRTLANEAAIEHIREEQKPMKELLVKIKFIHNMTMWVGGLLGIAHIIMKMIEMRQ